MIFLLKLRNDAETNLENAVLWIISLQKALAMAS